MIPIVNPPTTPTSNPFIPNRKFCIQIRLLLTDKICYNYFVDSKTSSAGYKYLLTYQLATVIYDLTIKFCDKYIDRKLRTYDQMTQAARSGKQNIAEGYLEKSLKSYIYLLGISLGSFGELREDFEDFLRQRQQTIWRKEDPRIRVFRKFRVIWEDPNNPKIPKLPNDPELAANFLLTLLNQEGFLLQKQISALEQKFVREGGYTENLFKKRISERNKRSL